MYMSSIQKRVSPESPSGVGFSHWKSASFLPSARYFGSLVRMYSSKGTMPKMLWST